MSTPIDLLCDQCQKKLRVPVEAAGKRVRCPHCQAVLSVPAADPLGQGIVPGTPPAPPPSRPAPAAISVEPIDEEEEVGPEEDDFPVDSGREVSGLLLRAPYGNRERLRSAILHWADEAGYRITRDTEDTLQITRGRGFLTAIREFRIRFRSAGRYDMVQLTPYIKNMGCVGTVDAKFMAAIPAAAARKDRDNLVGLLTDAVPGLQKKKIMCRVPGLPLVVFIILTIVISIIAGIIGFMAARGFR